MDQRVSDLESLVNDIPTMVNLRHERMESQLSEFSGRLNLIDRQLNMLTRDVRDLRNGVTRQLVGQDERPEVQFAYIELDGAELMLDQHGSGPADRRGIWVTGPMERPYGRGINFEIQTTDIDATLARVTAAGIPIYFGPEERWYRAGDMELGVRQFLVQDPDGYLVRMQQSVGSRPFKSL